MQEPLLFCRSLVKRLDDRSFRWTIDHGFDSKPAPFARHQGFRWDVCFRETEDFAPGYRRNIWLVLTTSSLQEPCRGISLPQQNFKVSIVDDEDRAVWTVSTAVSQSPVSPSVVACKTDLNLRLPEMTVERLKSPMNHFLVLQFNMSASNEVEEAYPEEDIEAHLKERAALLESIKALQHDTEDSDVTLDVSGRSFRAHRTILKARSPVFQRMFQSDMLERRSGVVEIPDCDPQAFEAYLQYLYTGDLDVVREGSAALLLYVARKYGSEGLVRHCHRFMEKNLTVCSFCEYLSALLADGEEPGSLDFAAQFFAANFLEIGRSQQWSEFFKANPVPANELMLKAHEASLARGKRGASSRK